MALPINAKQWFGTRPRDMINDTYCDINPSLSLDFEWHSLTTSGIRVVWQDQTSYRL